MRNELLFRKFSEFFKVLIEREKKKTMAGKILCNHFDEDNERKRRFSLTHTHTHTPAKS